MRRIRACTVAVKPEPDISDKGEAGDFAVEWFVSSCGESGDVAFARHGVSSSI